MQIADSWFSAVYNVVLGTAFKRSLSIRRTTCGCFIGLFQDWVRLYIEEQMNEELKNRLDPQLMHMWRHLMIVCDPRSSELLAGVNE